MAPQRSHILCVDDEHEALTTRTDVLENAGYQVSMANCSEEALEVLRSRDIDLVVADYYMTGGNGIALAKAVKEFRKDLPIIVLSGYVSLPDEGQGLIDDWILKSHDPREFLKVVDRLLSRVRENGSMR